MEGAGRWHRAAAGVDRVDASAGRSHRLPAPLSRRFEQRPRIGDRTSDPRTRVGHRSGTVPDSHRLRDPAVLFGMSGRAYHGASATGGSDGPTVGAEGPGTRPVRAVGDDAGLALLPPEPDPAGGGHRWPISEEQPVPERGVRRS